MLNMGTRAQRGRKRVARQPTRKGVQTIANPRSMAVFTHLPMNMKSLLSAVLFVCALPVGARAEAPKGWTDNYAQAVETAKTEKKYLLLDFTGSDWCGFCKLLDKEVFSTPQFANWAKKNVVLVQVDFPHQTPLTDEVKKQNSGLAAKYPVAGYPSIVVIKPSGKEIAKEVGYNPGTGAAAYIRGLETQMKKAGPLPGASSGENANGGGPKEPSIFKTTPIPSTLK
jgi:thioredoxin-related protein